MSQSDIGIYGLGLMGSNLALNFESHGHNVSVSNRTEGEGENLIASFMKEHGAGKRFTPSADLKEFVASIQKPRTILITITSGKPVDDFISSVLPHLDDWDTLVDCGNSHFEETRRRAASLRFKRINYAGVGISGGSEGARYGPSIMAGTTKKCWKSLEKILEPIAARSFDDTPCCLLAGSDGAGHFVKMVHNGIEYADMQILAEVYHIMRTLFKMHPSDISAKFRQWNYTSLGSYLLSISADILQVRDDSGVLLLDQILDSAEQKGTGRWTVQAASELGIQLPVVSASVDSRSLSALTGLRGRLSGSLFGPEPNSSSGLLRNTENALQHLEQAYLASRMIAAAEGFYLLTEASRHYKWTIDPSEIARIWQGGCIIRSELLRTIVAAYGQGSNFNHLLLSPIYSNRFRKLQEGWRETVTLAIKSGIHVPAMAASLQQYDALRSAYLPANLIQAQRDYFGSHGFRVINDPDGTHYHSNWNKQDLSDNTDDEPENSL
ncbi:NADP-dependent phosphogluconate dehydrogenase [Rhodohalobacter mucosus]|uniref:6-phosphogluconate dehydrogenase, decarboxylating n=1 Tax=Rhodohalobacter mucosus TaxID=2079485 RepID=A0A316TSE0_9BACT|nr:NADP-dependent phosphogluconate dehydrogenase [Rhodohalobacter mucosus]PWN07543.1 phosphogluconate dehydrogenase (NADP(+)-dependent, decarboxylating) [Rhodohalobacter mucosus]